jgi:hypothetical protein
LWSNACAFDLDLDPFLALYTAGISSSDTCDGTSADCIDKCCSLIPTDTCASQYAARNKQCQDPNYEAAEVVRCAWGVNCTDAICCTPSM